MTTMTNLLGKLPVRQALLHLVLFSIGLFMLYPLIWLVLGSFKSSIGIFSDRLWPTEWVPENYKQGWWGIPSMRFNIFFLNSAVLSLIVVVGNVASASLVAFAFARLNFALKSVWFAIMMLTMMIPAQVTLIPQYVLFHALGWVNTYLPLIIPHFLGATPFFTFLLIQFIRGVPRELDEAATIDGCGTFSVFWRIVMPLCGPALITVAIFSFIWTWDDFFGQLIYINDVKKYTVPLGLRLFIDSTGNSDWGPMLAMSVLSLLPNFIIFLTCQKYFVQGIVTSGLKG